MKKTLLVFLLFSSSIHIGFCQNAFKVVSETFKNNNQFFNTELSKKTIKLYLKDKTENEEISSILKNIENLKVLSFSTQNETDITKFLSIVNNQYNFENYVPFKINKSGINNQLIYLKEQDEIINTLLVLNTNYSQISMIEIKGTIDLESIVILNKSLNIYGLEALNTIQNKKKTNRKKAVLEKENYSINNKYLTTDKQGTVSVYNKSGNKIIETDKTPNLLVNGYLPMKDFHAQLTDINPECIQSIHVTKKDDSLLQNGQIDILLKGDLNNVFTICEGMLFFGQNGYLQCIKIDDDCSPELLYNCKGKPLSSILQLEPENVKSIELTADPRNCEGILEGEFVVVELK